MALQTPFLNHSQFVCCIARSRRTWRLKRHLPRELIYFDSCAIPVTKLASLLNLIANISVVPWPLMIIFPTGSHVSHFANSTRIASMSDIPLISTLDGDLHNDVNFFSCTKTEYALQIQLVSSQAGIHGPKPGIGADQDPEKFQNLGPDRTRTNKSLKISNRFGPVGPRT